MKKIYLQPSTVLVKTELKLMQVTSVGIAADGSADDSRKAKGINHNEDEDLFDNPKLFQGSNLWD